MKGKKAGDDMQDANQQLFFTVCPRCNYPNKDARQVAAGRAGGKAKVPKGLSNPEVQKKAQAALALVRAAKREAKARAKAEAQKAQE